MIPEAGSGSGKNEVEIQLPKRVAEPIRGEIFSAEHLEALAESLAATHAAAVGKRRGYPLLRRVDENGKALRAAHRAIAGTVKAEAGITPAAEWLADNFHVVDEQLRDIRDHLPPSYYRDLPKLTSGEFARYPRVYAIICPYIAHTDSRVDADVLLRFVRAYQRVQPLTIGELWAVAITLRVALIENLRRLADWVVGSREARLRADRVADSLLGLRSLSTEGNGKPDPESWERFGQSPFFAGFAVQLFQRLQDQVPGNNVPLEWLGDQLGRREISSQELIRIEHQKQASLNVSVRNIITSMRLILELDWKLFFEKASLVEEILGKAPGYSGMDFTSRDLYRHAVEDLSRGARQSEIRVATMAVETAANPDSPETDVGYLLIGKGRRDFEMSIGYRADLRHRTGRTLRRRASWIYPIAVLGLTALFASAGVESLRESGIGWWGVALLGLLGAFPLSEGVLALVNRCVTAVLPPRILPKLELLAGIPRELRTLVAIPALLRNEAEARELVERLEVHYLANPDGDILFALLSDWGDAPAAEMPGDAALLASAESGIAELNARHGPAIDGGPRFFLLHRKRLWNPGEGKWLGWERKRGKLAELNRLLRGRSDVTFLLPKDGSAAVPEGVKFVLTLDSDTRLPKGAAARMVGALAHPLNRPRFDAKVGRVVKGYGILQPRVVPALPEGRERTLFHWLTSGPAGIDPYAAAISDVYQDLWGEGSFSGKGIYDVDAVESALQGRIPDNTLLSHDLFEGSFARAGLLSDLEVLEDFPAHYWISAARSHRWVRGDWQLLPWILGRRSLPFLGRWKMLDNLRRSLVPGCTLLALALGWLLPAHPSGPWTLAILVALMLPYMVPASEAIVPPRAGISKRSYLRETAQVLIQAGCHYLMSIAILAHQAWLMSDAIFRTLLRLFITHRKMLEWVTAAQAKSQVRTGLLGFIRSMAAAPVLSALLGISIAVKDGGGSLVLVSPFLLLWFLSPVLAMLISRPRGLRQEEILPDQARREFRGLALKTWRFFHAFVGRADNFLPPDNFQEDPKPVVAHRTSPTNMGLYLLSTITARDLGFLGLAETVDRLEATLSSMGKLECYRGHFFNWYDTTDLRPLEPRYVSTVDSGNLAGHLLALRRACQEYISSEILSPSLEDGMIDLIGLVREAASVCEDDLRTQAFGRKDLLDGLAALEALLLPVPADAGEWAARVGEWEIHSDAVVDVARLLALEQGGETFRELQEAAEFLQGRLRGIAGDLQSFFPWVRAGISVEALAGLPLPETQGLLHGRVTLEALARRCRATAEELRVLSPELDSNGGGTAVSSESCEDLAMELENAGEKARDMVRRLSNIAATCWQLCLDMDFSFLQDPGRKLFAIGFRVREEVLDPSYYDLLASEARLASFLAIAKGDVAPAHWFRLGRTLTPVGHGAALLSWSGSMFEYMMPRLVMRSPPGSLLDQACRYAVQRQIEYGRDHGIPWGVSEAAYNVRDLEMTYQYSSFGVPGLGLKRGLSGDLVIAPYATALASMVAPRAAVENFARLRAEGAEGRYGFYEAIDYTRLRVLQGRRATLVKSHFAHHQGMIMLSLGDVLLNGRMQSRFHSEPIVQAVDPLLHERAPKGATVARLHADEIARPLHVETPLPSLLHRFSSPHEPIPRTHILSNGRYTVLLSAAGSGFSRWRGLAVTRWREDATLDAYGQYLYLRDPETGSMWSAAYQPTAVEPDAYEVSFAEDRAEVIRREGNFSSTLEIVVSSEDDAEVRRLTLENRGGRDREIEITSYAEVVLATAEADAAHPAFSNLFVRTEFVPDLGALLATRKPRSTGEAQPWAAHVCGVEGETQGGIGYETDRARFLGRGHGVRSPVSVADGKPLTNTVGPVLDPIFSLRRRVRIPAGGRVRLAFVTLAASTREEALQLADKYRDPGVFERVATLAWTQAQIQLRHLGIGPDDARLYQRLANRLFFPDAALRPTPDLLAMNTRGQDSLWPFGISGDFPIILARFDEAGDRNLVRDLLKAHAYLEMKNLEADLVILNENPDSYLQEQQAELEGLLRLRRTGPKEANPSGGAGAGPAPRGGIFLLRKDHVSREERVLLQASARVVLVGRRGSLSDQVMRSRRFAATPPPLKKRAPSAAIPGPPSQRPPLEFFNGLGGFGAEGKEYQIILSENRWTPAPWVNVVANPGFGFLASESGSGFTWCGNSRECKLTPWSNDPVADPPGEAVYVRDRDTGDLWTPTALPIREEQWPYVAIHGQGYSRFLHTSHGIRLELTQWVPTEDPVKLSRLILENQSDRTRHLSVTFYVEWVLGVSRGLATMHTQTLRDPETGAILAFNTWNAEFAERTAFADLGGKQSSWTCDRTEFLGRNGDVTRPRALVRGETLSGQIGPGLDPCCAQQAVIEIPPDGKVQLLFALGQAGDKQAAAALVRKYRGPAGETSLKAVADFWDGLLDRMQIKTPDRSMDLLLNRWLPYQTLACRMWARAGFYQAGGAFGFRDQIQDAVALCALDPTYARGQILRASARQFLAGDVQHWWHPPSGRGVRTHFSDDRVWLPYAVLEYLRMTLDASVLDEVAPFLEGPDVPEGREDAYFQPKSSAESGSIFEHCARALDRSLGVGIHGLPLMGSGDWNDGMNRVGHLGKGESGWLAWFLIPVLKGFSDLAAKRGEAARADAWKNHAEALREAMEKEGWDGDWYRRGYFDDGSPLGSSANLECRIDSIAQSWALLSGAADPARARRAMFSMEEYLIRRGEALALLFTPPFDKSPQDPGYIKGYLPGVRENGGQYTHAAAWAVAAFAELGEGDKAVELLSLINPINHASSRAGVYRYKVEPYVLAADVYSEPPHAGRGGWTWYTGSAGWLLRAGLEWILGFRLHGNMLRMEPCIPRDWRRFEIRLRNGPTTTDIVVLNPSGQSRGIAQCEVDGLRRDPPCNEILLPADGKAHQIRLIIG